MNIKIEGTDTLERIASALERIITLLEKPGTETHARTPESVKPTPVEVEAPKPEPVETAEPEPVAAEPVADQPEEVKKTVTLEEIRKKVVQLSAQGPKSKEAVRGIVTEFARKVSEIPADKYGEIMERLDAVKEV